MSPYYTRTNHLLLQALVAGFNRVVMVYHGSLGLLAFARPPVCTHAHTHTNTWSGAWSFWIENFDTRCICAYNHIQVVLVLRDFALTWLENLHYFSNLCDNFRFNAIWHRRFVVMLLFCRRLAGSDVSVTPSVTCMAWLRWWYNDAALLVSSLIALAFLTSMSEKHIPASPSAIQVKSQRKTVGIKEKLQVISLI
jgi:hypothetical protein